MSKQLLVIKQDGKKFRVTVPDGAKVTFGPWSPPGEKTTNYTERALTGTLRIYESAKSGASILGCFSGIHGFRDLTLNYEEEILTQKVATVWESDNNGYKREESASFTSSFDQEQLGPGDDPNYN